MGEEQAPPPLGTTCSPCCQLVVPGEEQAADCAGLRGHGCPLITTLQSVAGDSTAKVSRLEGGRGGGRGGGTRTGGTRTPSPAHCCPSPALCPQNQSPPPTPHLHTVTCLPPPPSPAHCCPQTLSPPRPTCTLLPTNSVSTPKQRSHLQRRPSIPSSKNCGCTCGGHVRAGRGVGVGHCESHTHTGLTGNQGHKRSHCESHIIPER